MASESGGWPESPPSAIFFAQAAQVSACTSPPTIAKPVQSRVLRATARTPASAEWYDVKSTADIPSTSVSVMSTRSTFLSASIILLLILAPTLWGQAGDTSTGGSGSLQQHYDQAQELHRAGNLSDAAEQYHAFIADGLGELAMGYSLAGDYTHAAASFDEALTLEPGSAYLLLDYARTELMLGHLAHAKTLATEFIKDHPDDRVRLAQAHQLLGRALLELNQDREARKEFEAAVGLDPTFANGYDLAVACLDLDNEKCAVQIFGEMEKSFGDTPQLHMAFGRAYGGSDFQPRAVAEFKNAIAENPRLPRAHYLLAAALLETGGDQSQVAEAQADLKKELLLSPRDPQAYAALGKLAATRNNYPEAQTYLKRAISLGPQSPDAYLYLGQMYFEMHRSADAEAVLRQCIRLTADASRNRYQVQKAHFLLGRILTQKGQPDAAQAEMQIARDLSNKTLAQDRSKLASLMDTSASDGAPSADVIGSATPAAEPSSVVDPMAEQKVDAMKGQLKGAVADSYNNLGAIAATKNDYSDAIMYFEHAAVWNPSLEGLDYNWGRAAFAGSRFADAVVPLSRYVTAHPDDDGARSVLAISQFMTKNYRGCIEALQPAIGKPGLAPQAEYVYAESMIKTGQIVPGTERLVALEKSHPEIPDVHRSLGEALAERGEKQQAIGEFRTALQLSPNDSDSHYDLGKMELETGDTRAALPELEAAVQLSPDSEKYHRELAVGYTVALRPADAQKEMDTYNMLRARAQKSSSSNQAGARER